MVYFKIALVDANAFAYIHSNYLYYIHTYIQCIYCILTFILTIIITNTYTYMYIETYMHTHGRPPVKYIEYVSATR